MKKIFMGLILTSIMLSSSILPSMSFAEEQKEEVKIESLKVERITGKDRYQTAVEISKQTFPEGAKYVAIATGVDFVDGLVGGTLTSQEDSPLLLTRSNSINQETLNEIERLKPETVFLFGGEAAISKSVEEEINKLEVKIERISGKDRFQTSERIGWRRTKLKYPAAEAQGDRYHVVSATVFADALSAAPFLGTASKMNIDSNPLILSEGIEINHMTPARFVFGGLNAVPRVGEDKRFVGKTRYETAVEVAKAYKTELKVDIDTVVLVSGEDFPDGLASASVATMNNGAVLLTNTASLNKATKDFIVNNKNIKKVIIVGGEAAVSEAVEKELKKIQVEVEDEVTEPTAETETDQ